MHSNGKYNVKLSKVQYKLVNEDCINIDIYTYYVGDFPTYDLCKRGKKLHKDHYIDFMRGKRKREYNKSIRIQTEED